MEDKVREQERWRRSMRCMEREERSEGRERDEGAWEWRMEHEGGKGE